jgi:hypothetical protein
MIKKVWVHEGDIELNPFNKEYKALYHASDYDALVVSLVEARQAQISVFSEEQYPQYKQGAPTHELEELMTAIDCSRLIELIKQHDAQWNSIEALQDRLLELHTQRIPADRTIERLIDHLNADAALSKMPAKELVDLALHHLSDFVEDNHYEQIVEELCTRVWPNWPNEGGE